MAGTEIGGGRRMGVEGGDVGVGGVRTTLAALADDAVVRVCVTDSGGEALSPTGVTLDAGAWPPGDATLEVAIGARAGREWPLAPSDWPGGEDTAEGCPAQLLADLLCAGACGLPGCRARDAAGGRGRR